MDEKLEKQIADTEAEIADTKKTMAAIEELSEGHPQRDRLPVLEKNLVALRADLAVLREQKVFLLKQAAIAAQAPPDVDDIIERAVKRARAKEEEVSVSKFGSEHWNHLSSVAGLHMSHPIRLSSTGSKATPDTKFMWTEAPENQQADRYMPHLKRIIPISNRTFSPLVWLEGGNKHKSLLSMVGMERVLYYSSIKGNTDVAIVTRTSNAVMLPSRGLCILFELKKPENMGQAAVYQAACQVVLANMLSPDFSPVVVLTDLQDHWQLHWLNGSDLMSGLCDSRSDALAVIAACVRQAEQKATMASEGLAAEAPTPAATTIQLPTALVSRRPAAFGQAPGGQSDASLADLSGDLPDDELRAAHISALMQQLSQLPVFSNMAQSKPPPFPMYS